jgi:hypothetical protein
MERICRRRQRLQVIQHDVDGRRSHGAWPPKRCAWWLAHEQHHPAARAAGSAWTPDGHLARRWHGRAQDVSGDGLVPRWTSPQQLGQLGKQWVHG